MIDYRKKEKRSIKEHRANNPHFNYAAIAKHNLFEIKKYLDGIEYPISKYDLMNCVVNKGAPVKFLYILNEIKETIYASENHVAEELLNIK